MTNILTIDVEEYFHPTEIQRSGNSQAWTHLPSRIESELGRVLDLLSQHDVSATFFVLGWVAHHHPQVVRRIVRAGHEVGCHSYAHKLVYDMRPQQFRADTEQAVAAIEDAGGVTPRAYRAPSYSITARSMWALDILAELGFTHDSSIYPIKHDRYGIPDFERHAQTLTTPSGPILEVPIATLDLYGRHTAPIGGGAYLRLLPYRYTAAGIRRLNEQEGRPACIYFHPWEIDPDQPRLASSILSRVRTYTGLRSMQSKLDRLLAEFRFSTLSSVYPAVARAPRLQVAGA